MPLLQGGGVLLRYSKQSSPKPETDRIYNATRRLVGGSSINPVKFRVQGLGFKVQGLGVWV